MTPKKCHPANVHFKKDKLRLTLTFKGHEANAILKAADIFTKGCVCELVHTLFMDRFIDLTKEIDSQKDK